MFMFVFIKNKLSKIIDNKTDITADNDPMQDAQRVRVVLVFNRTELMAQNSITPKINVHELTIDARQRTMNGQELKNREQAPSDMNNATPQDTSNTAASFSMQHRSFHLT